MLEREGRRIATTATRPAARVPAAPAEAASTFGASSLVALQRTAGNTAVDQLVRSRRAAAGRTGTGAAPVRLVLQRSTGEDETSDVGPTDDAQADLGEDVAPIVEDVAAGAAEAASGAWDAITGTLDDLTDAAATGANVVWDEATERADRLVDGVGEAASGAWDQLADAARDVSSDASEAAGEAWDAVADTASGVATRVEDAADRAWDTASDVASGAWDAVTETADEMADTVRDIAAEAWDEVTTVAGDAWDAVEGGASSLWDSVIDGTSRGLEEIAKNVSVPGAQVQSRGLTGGEIDTARQVFGDGLDYNVVVVTRGSIMALGSSRTTGNVVDLEDRYFIKDSLDLTGDGVSVLVHELAHVFQFQHGGLAYIPDSLWEQLISKIKTGSVDQAYDWRIPDGAGIPWEEWHAEQQAQAVQDYNDLLMLVGPLTTTQEATLARLVRYADKMRRGPTAQTGAARASSAVGG